MPDELTPFARELITRCPNLINRFAEKINSMIYNWEYDELPLEPIDIEIQHVGYTAEQCGYEK